MSEAELRLVAGEWLDHATADLRAAEHLLSATPALPAAVAFHAQQAVEKLLKAMLVLQNTNVPRTHDLVALGERITTTVLPLTVADLAHLTEYAVQVRYPGAPEVTTQEAHEAQGLAVKLHEMVTAFFAALPAEGP